VLFAAIEPLADMFIGSQLELEGLQLGNGHQQRKIGDGKVLGGGELSALQDLVEPAHSLRQFGPLSLVQGGSNKHCGELGTKKIL